MRAGSRVLGTAIVGIFVFVGPAASECRDTPGDWKAGDAIYHQTCIDCHGQEGHGVRRGVPDFTSGVMAYPVASLAAHIKNGFGSSGRSLAMPPKGGNPALTDEDIRNVIAYLRHSFGCG